MTAKINSYIAGCFVEPSEGRYIDKLDPRTGANGGRGRRRFGPGSRICAVEAASERLPRGATCGLPNADGSWSRSRGPSAGKGSG